MENKAQGIGTPYTGSAPATGVVYAATAPSAAAQVGSVEPVRPTGASPNEVQPVVPAPGSPSGNIPEPPQKRQLKKLLVTAGLVAGGLLLIGGAAFGIEYFRKGGTENQQNASRQFDNTQVPLENLVGQDGISVLGARSLIINGLLRTTGSLVVSPSDQPDAPTAGQIYFDEDSDEFGFYDGSQFIYLSPPAPEEPPAAAPPSVGSIDGATGDITTGTGLVLIGGSLTNTGVLSFQGQTGNVTLTAGTGINISGTTISSTLPVGVTNVVAGGGLVRVGSGTTLDPYQVALQTCANGEVLKSAGGGAWACALDEGTSHTAGNGLQLVGVQFSIDSPTCNGSDKLRWTGTAFECAPDAGGVLYQAGTGLDLVGDTFSNTGTLVVTASGALVSTGGQNPDIAFADGTAAGEFWMWDGDDWMLTDAGGAGLSYSAGNGLQLTGNQFSIDSPTCNGTEKLQWNGTDFVCAADQNTTYTAGTGLNLAGTQFNNTGILTISGSSTIGVSAGQNPTVAFTDGTADGQIWVWDDGGGEWVLATADGAGLAYSAGNGLQLNANEFAIDSPTCNGTDKLQWTGTAFDCAADQNTTYTAGTGLGLVGTQFSNTGILTISGSDTIQVSAGQNPTVAFVDGTEDGQIWIWDDDVGEWVLALISDVGGDGVIGNEVVGVTGANSGLVRSGAGTFGNPYTLAVNTGDGLQLSGGAVLIDSPTCNGTDKLQWTGTAFLCVADVDTNTTYNVITDGGLRLSGTNFGLAVCADGQVLQAQAVSGEWDCANPDGIGITYTAGDGLQLNGNEFAIDSPTCDGTDKLQWDGEEFVCAADIDTNTTYTAGTGMSLVGTQFNNTGILTISGSSTINVTAGQNPTVAFVDGSEDGQIWMWSDGDQEWELVTLPAGATGFIEDTAGEEYGLVRLGDGTSLDPYVLAIKPCATGELLQSDGDGEWICASPGGVGTSYNVITDGGLRLSGTNFGLAVCANGQILQAQPSSGEWACASPDGVGTSYTAGDGLALDVTEFSIDSPTCDDTDKLQWDGTDFVCAADEDTTYTAGTGLDLVGTEFQNTGILTISGSDTIQVSAGQNPTVAFVDGTADGQIWMWNDGEGEWELVDAAAMDGDGVVGNEVVGVTGANSGLTRSGAGTSGSPYTLAVNTGNGLQLSGGAVLIDSPTCNGTDKLQWTGTAFLCVADVDTNTTYNTIADGGLRLSGTSFGLMICADGQVLQAQAVSGEWDCADSDSVGTTYTAGDGLQLNGNEFAIDSPTCDGTDKLQWDGEEFVCATDVDTDTTYGTITDSGLRLSGTDFGLMICVDGQVLQAQTVSGEWDCANSDSVGTQYAAGDGLVLDTNEFSIDSPTCNGTDKLTWTGSAFSCEEDEDTTYTAGSGLTLVGDEFALDTCATNGVNGYVCLGGNSTGSQFLIGTGDDENVNIMRNGISQIFIEAGRIAMFNNLEVIDGDVLFHTESTSAFRVINDDTTVLSVDTDNERVGIRTASPGAALHLAQAGQGSQYGLRISQGGNSIDMYMWTGNVQRLDFATTFRVGHDEDRAASGTFQAGRALNLNTHNQGNQGEINFQIEGTDIVTLSNTGQALFQNISNSSTAFQILSTSDTLFTANTSNNRIQIGNATGTNTATTLLVLDSATTDPTTNAVNGAMYYNTDTDQFRCYIDGDWENCSGETVDTNNFFAQGGNAFGGTAILGTTDAFGLDIITDEDVVASFSSTGQAAFQASEDSESAFSILNANGDHMINVDSVAGKITLAPTAQSETNVAVERVVTASSDNGPSFLNIPNVEITGEHRYLLVGVGINHDDFEHATSVVIDPGGDDETELSRLTFGEIEDDGRVELWGAPAPPLGTYTVRVTLNAAMGEEEEIIAGAWVLSGVDQTTPVRHGFGSGGSSASATVEITTNPGDVVFGQMYMESAVEHNYTITTDAPAITDWDIDEGDDTSLGAHRAASGGFTTTLSWSISDPDKWAAAAVSMTPAKTNAVDVIGALNVDGNLQVDGMAAFQNTTNSDQAFQILNSAGDSLMNADTMHNSISFGNPNHLHSPEIISIQNENLGGGEPTINLANSPNPGDLLVIMISSRFGSTHSVPGWTPIGIEGSSGSGSSWVGYRIAAGNEVTISPNWGGDSGTDVKSAYIFRIKGHDPSRPPEATTNIGTSSSSSIASPTLTPSWGEDDNLWLTLAALVSQGCGGSCTVSNYPLPDNQHRLVNTQNNYAARSTQNLRSASLSPGNWEFSNSSDERHAYTVAVAPLPVFGMGVHGGLNVNGSVNFDGLEPVASGGHNVLCVEDGGGEVREGISATTCDPSSIRFKENVQDLAGEMGLDVINALRPVNFTYKDGDGRERIGLIAEEVAEILPEVVAYDADGQPAGIDYAYLTVSLILGIQQQQVQIDELREGVLSGGLIEIAGHIRVGDDTAGTAMIEAGDTEVEVTFEQPYEYVPKITTGSSAFVHVIVTDKSETGFTVRIADPQSEDVHIDWTALEVESP